MSGRALRVVSGGQTGVDRGALDAALELGVDCGGWCPAGRRAEDGVIADIYPLRETRSSEPGERTRRNVEDSDGTLVIDFPESGPGTRLTIDCAKALGKPLLVIPAAEMPCAMAVDLVLDFVRRTRLEVINVAGPRSSEVPEAYAYAHDLIRSLLHPGQRPDNV